MACDNDVPICIYPWKLQLWHASQWKGAKYNEVCLSIYWLLMIRLMVGVFSPPGLSPCLSFCHTNGGFCMCSHTRVSCDNDVSICIYPLKLQLRHASQLKGAKYNEVCLSIYWLVMIRLMVGVFPPLGLSPCLSCPTRTGGSVCAVTPGFHVITMCQYVSTP